MKKLIILFQLCTIFSLGFAQKIAIPDPEFASYLCSNYPAVVNSNCDSLLTGPAQNIEGYMDFSGSSIVDGQFLVHFHRVDSLDLSDNPQMIMIDSLQAADFWSLDYINMSNNQLDSLPFFSINPDYVIVSELVFANNNLTTFQKYWSGRDSIRILDLSNNYLSDIEDWTPATLAERFDFSNNYLTFEDILPQTNHVNFTTVFTVSPQRKVKWKESLITGKENQGITIDLDIDDNVTGNTYTWFHNGIEIEITSTNKLVIDSLSLVDAGKYMVRVTNDNALLDGVELETEDLTLMVTPCMNISDFNYNLVEQCYGAELSFDPMLVNGGVEPYSFVIKDSQNVETMIKDGEMKVLTGTYQFEINDNVGCSKLIETDLVISPLSGCDKLVITPDGDGLQDEYYFPQTGHAIIYNQNGSPLAEFNLPGFWDARTSNGSIVSPGKYVMVIDDKEQIELVIVW